MSKFRIDQVNIEDEITYTNTYVKYRYSTGIVVGKMDESLLLVEIKGSTDRKLVEISDVETVNGK